MFKNFQISRNFGQFRFGVFKVFKLFFRNNRNFAKSSASETYEIMRNFLPKLTETFLEISVQTLVTNELGAIYYASDLNLENT